MKLTITIEMPGSIDARITDPHEVGEGLIYEYNEWARVNGADSVEFVDAEWKP